MELSIPKKFIEYGLSVIPVGDKKIPTIKWQKYQSVLMEDWEMTPFLGVDKIGIVSGKVSGNLEMIDIDAKYDITGTMYEDYCKEIPEILFKKLVIQSTQNGGYHFIYRCKVIEGNQKLSQRGTTEEEKKVNPHEKCKVLFETRGEGGYFLSQPSKGYKIIQGKLSEIQEISEIEREYLLELARTFNTYEEPMYTPREVILAEKSFTISPFDDFDNKCDVPSLLVEHGWTIARNTNDVFFMKRPNTENLWSGTYSRSKNWFTVFSTSTEFEPLKAYKPYAVWAKLNGISDFSEAAKELVRQGYGTKQVHTPKPYEKDKEEISPEDLSFITNWYEARKLLEDFIDGKIPMGLSTGFRNLDDYFRFKRGNLVEIIGLDNTGKSTIALFFAMISAVKHGWKWVIFCGENGEMSIMHSLMQFYWSKPLREITYEERNEAQTFIERHFVNIKNDELINFGGLKKRFEAIYSNNKFDGLLVDPYNALDASKETNSYEFKYSTLNELKIFGKEKDVAVWLTIHPVTAAYRKKDDNGYLLAPDKGDAEFGTMFPAKADEFITVHRVTNHEDEKIRLITEFHVRKVKEKFTGGSPTSKDNPFTMIMSNYGSVFYDANDVLRTHPFKANVNNLDFEDIINSNTPF